MNVSTYKTDNCSTGVLQIQHVIVAILAISPLYKPLLLRDYLLNTKKYLNTVQNCLREVDESKIVPEKFL